MNNSTPCPRNRGNLNPVRRPGSSSAPLRLCALCALWGRRLRAPISKPPILLTADIADARRWGTRQQMNAPAAVPRPWPLAGAFGVSGSGAAPNWDCMHPFYLEGRGPPSPHSVRNAFDRGLFAKRPRGTSALQRSKIRGLEICGHLRNLRLKRLGGLGSSSAPLRLRVKIGLGAVGKSPDQSWTGWTGFGG